MEFTDLELGDPVHDALYRAGCQLLGDGLQLGDTGLLERAIGCFERILESVGELSDKQSGIIEGQLVECYIGLGIIRGGDAAQHLPYESAEMAWVTRLLDRLVEPDPFIPMDDEVIRIAFTESPWQQIVVGALANLSLARAGSHEAAQLYERALAVCRRLLRETPEDITDEQRPLLRLLEARCLRGLLVLALRGVVNFATTESAAGKEATPILQRLAAVI